MVEHLSSISVALGLRPSAGVGGGRVEEKKEKEITLCSR